jgi:hypothetical protein
MQIGFSRWVLAKVNDLRIKVEQNKKTSQNTYILHCFTFSNIWDII